MLLLAHDSYCLTMAATLSGYVSDRLCCSERSVFRLYNSHLALLPGCIIIFQLFIYSYKRKTQRGVILDSLDENTIKPNY